MNTVDTGVEGIPQDLPIMQTYERIQDAFPGGSIPLVAVVEADDVTDPEVVAAAKDLRKQALAHRPDERAGRRQRQPGRRPSP